MSLKRTERNRISIDRSPLSRAGERGIFFFSSLSRWPLLMVFLGMAVLSGCVKGNGPPFPMLSLPPGTGMRLSQPVPVIPPGQKVPRSLRYVGTLDAIASPSAGHVLVVGAQSAIWKTDDGGTTWKPVTPPVPGDFYGIVFVSPRNGWIAGDGGLLLHTTDGGDHWVRVAVPVKDFYLQAMSFPDPEHGFVAGEKGIVLATSDGGATWKRLVVPTVENLYGVAFLTPSHGYISGWHETLFETTDGGKSFHPIDLHLDRVTRQEPSFNVLATDGKRLLLAGDHGLAFYSPDGTPDHFVRLTLPVTNDLYGACLLPDGSMALSGEGGVLLTGKAVGGFSSVLKSEGNLAQTDFLGLTTDGGKLSVAGTLGVILTPGS